MNPMMMNMNNQMMMNQMMMNQMGNPEMNSNNFEGNQMQFNNNDFNNNDFNNNNFNNIEVRIKNVVEPYEEKIKELEDKLRQKDFEIIVLKEKLYACQSQLNPNQINMNMDMNLQNLINNSQNDDSKINVNFRFSGKNLNKDFPVIKEQCSLEEIFEDVLKRISYKYQFIYKKYIFILNAKRINHNLTLGECGFSNNCNIFIIKPINSNKKDEDKDEDEDIIENISNNIDFPNRKINIVFKTVQGVIFNFHLNQNRSIGMALELFIERMILKKEDIDKIYFLYNASKINLYDSTSLKKFFKNNNNPTIVVNDVNNIIGA